MGLLAKIQSFLGRKTPEEIKTLKDYIKVRFGLEEFVYATREGLLILGTSDNCEEMAAFVPEMVKTLYNMDKSEYYSIETPNAVYTLAEITPEVIFFGKGKRKMGYIKLKELIKKSREELGLD